MIHLIRIILKWLEWFLDIMERIVSVLIGITLGFIVLINIAEVISRYLGEGSIYWVHELTILLVSWITFLGIGVIYRHNSDAAVETFINYFPVKVRKIIKFIVLPIVIVFLLIIIWRTVLYYSYQKYPSPALGVPTNLFTLPIIIGSGVIALCFLREILNNIETFKEPGGEKRQAELPTHKEEYL